MTHRSTDWLRTIAIPAVAALTLTPLAACDDGNTNNPQPQPTVTRDHALHPFESCDQLRDYTSDVMVEELVRARYGGWLEEMDGGAGPARNDSQEQDAPTDYTETNNQEEGVDEADLVKTDGLHIYVAHGDELAIVKSWPAEDTQKIGTVSLGGNAHSLFLHGDRAIVFSYVYEDLREPDEYGRAYWHGTRISTVDVSDRSHPRAIRHIDVEGYFVDGRMIDGVV